jgi:hypothetical protein
MDPLLIRLVLGRVGWLLVGVSPRGYRGVGALQTEDLARVHSKGITGAAI